MGMVGAIQKPWGLRPGAFFYYIKNNPIYLEVDGIAVGGFGPFFIFSDFTTIAPYAFFYLYSGNVKENRGEG
jgi:hypothetical protein